MSGLPSPIVTCRLAFVFWRLSFTVWRGSVFELTLGRQLLGDFAFGVDCARSPTRSAVKRNANDGAEQDSRRDAEQRKVAEQGNEPHERVGRKQARRH
jgi:hypothetical protein